MTQFSSTLSPRSWSKETRLGVRVIVGFILLYVAISVVKLVLGVGPNLFLKWLNASPDIRAYGGSTLNFGLGIVMYAIFPAIAFQKVLGVNAWERFFLTSNWWKELLFGFLLVGLVLGTFFAAAVAAGWLVVEGWNGQLLPVDALLRTAWVGLLVNAGVALGEETLFRGYLLSGLKAAWGTRAGLVVMTIVFGLFHVVAYIEGGLEPFTLTVAIILASLFGLLFGLIYLRTGSLWLPIGLHFAWNFLENDVLNITAVANNPNLIGAVTRLQGPLTMSAVSWGNVVGLETLAFGLIALGAWAWLRHQPVH